MFCIKLKHERYLPEALVSFEQDHGGELQQTDHDGALAVVVLVHLPRAEVGAPLTRRETTLCCCQFTSGQLRQEEVCGFQEARFVL